LLFAIVNRASDYTANAAFQSAGIQNARKGYAQNVRLRFLKVAVQTDDASIGGLYPNALHILAIGSIHVDAPLQPQRAPLGAMYGNELSFFLQRPNVPRHRRGRLKADSSGNFPVARRTAIRIATIRDIL